MYSSRGFMKSSTTKSKANRGRFLPFSLARLEALLRKPRHRRPLPYHHFGNHRSQDVNETFGSQQVIGSAASRAERPAPSALSVPPRSPIRIIREGSEPAMKGARRTRRSASVKRGSRIIAHGEQSRTEPVRELLPGAWNPLQAVLRMLACIVSVT